MEEGGLEEEGGPGNEQQGVMGQQGIARGVNQQGWVLCVFDVERATGGELQNKQVGREKGMMDEGASEYGAKQQGCVRSVSDAEHSTGGRRKSRWGGGKVTSRGRLALISSPTPSCCCPCPPPHLLPSWCWPCPTLNELPELSDWDNHLYPCCFSRPPHPSLLVAPAPLLRTSCQC